MSKLRFIIFIDGQKSFKTTGFPSI